MAATAKEDILLIGTGPMAIEYTKVLKHQGSPFQVVGRSEDSAKKFQEATGITPLTGGIDEWLKQNKGVMTQAIVAVTENELGRVTLALLENGYTKILVEKPAGASYDEIKAVAREAKARQAQVYVGYNRRFNTSTLKAKQMIQEDGGLVSFSFEFTEWSHIVGNLKKAPGVLPFWFMHNSSHVIDLAFFLGGEAQKMTSYSSGGLAWHPAASIFAGAGVSENGSLFSYQANWEAPGRWWVELLTRKHRLILRPLEELHIQLLGSVAINKVELANQLDTQFKPGLYRQVESFLSDSKIDLCTISEQESHLSYYKKINHGGSL